MKVYKVTFEACKVDGWTGRQEGETKTIDVLVHYPHLDPNHPSSCIPESEREAKAKRQFREMYPSLHIMKCRGSISAGGHRNDLV